MLLKGGARSYPRWIVGCGFETGVCCCQIHRWLVVLQHIDAWYWKRRRGERKLWQLLIAFLPGDGIYVLQRALIEVVQLGPVKNNDCHHLNSVRCHQNQHQELKIRCESGKAHAPFLFEQMAWMSVEQMEAGADLAAKKKMKHHCLKMTRLFFPI